MSDEAEAMHRELSKYGVVSEGTAWRMYDENARLRAELADTAAMALVLDRELSDAAAAIARIRTLCAASRLCGYEDDGVCREWCECGWGSVWTGSLEAALDGGTE